MTDKERERLLERAATLQDADLADAILASEDWQEQLAWQPDWRECLAWQEGDDGNSLNETIPADATLDPDHLLTIWESINRCATVAADALASEYERTTDFRPNRDGLRERFAAEIWLTVADTAGWARGDILDGLA